MAANLLLVLAVLTACADGPSTVSVAELVTQEASYEGELVQTQGVVRTFGNPRHYWIEDARLNRVGLVPEEVVAPQIGREVRVVGRFHFDERTGRVIEVESIEPLGRAVDG